MLSEHRVLQLHTALKKGFLAEAELSNIKTNVKEEIPGKEIEESWSWWDGETSRAGGHCCPAGRARVGGLLSASRGIKVLVSLGPVIGLVQPSPLAMVRVERPVSQSSRPAFLVFDCIGSGCVDQRLGSQAETDADKVAAHHSLRQ
ncbi:hypothetical protein SRHO_G00205780 [Serrasalmus rhombeus]